MSNRVHGMVDLWIRVPVKVDAAINEDGEFIDHQFYSKVIRDFHLHYENLLANLHKEETRDVVVCRKGEWKKINKALHKRRMGEI